MSATTTTDEVDTPLGPARVHLDPPAGEPRALLVLGHGAGGGVEAPAPAAQLDIAWAAVVEHLRVAHPGLDHIHGGRSSGARVACRGAATLGPVAVLVLAFPLLAPARKDGTRPDRGPEIDAVPVPVLAVSGRDDRFGVPEPTARREVVVVAGDHSLKARRPIADAVGPWLARVLVPTPTGP